jgi:aldehyde dehydrogenase (NAD+)
MPDTESNNTVQVKDNGGSVTITFPHIGKTTTIQTGLFVNNTFIPSESGKTLEVLNPATGKVICNVSEASSKDVDAAVDSARKAFKTTWGLNVNGATRGRLLNKLADLIEQNQEELAAIEALDNGKAYKMALGADLQGVVQCIRYYAGWADKIHGKTIEVDDNTTLAYTRHEPLGVCGQIIPWNFPLMMWAWKIAPALATGNTVVLKTAEQTPLSALKCCEYIVQAGFPSGVLNVVVGYGPTTGAAIASHPRIDKVAFTGSTAVGRTVMKLAADSNLKKVTLELGGKSPNIVFEDADIEQAIRWSVFGIFFNHGQCCCAGSRIFVQESIFQKFVETFQKISQATKVGNPFDSDTFQGPQISQLQYDRIMDHIESGKKEAKLVYGGKRVGTEGFFIEQTMFTDVPEDSRIAQEEIFGPVVIVNTFKTEEEVIEKANNTVYGLASAVFTKDLSRAHRVAAKIEAGTVWVNNYNIIKTNVPFGGFKASGIGRELGEYALANYTNVKSVMVNLSAPAPI